MPTCATIIMRHRNPIGSAIPDDIEPVPPWRRTASVWWFGSIAALRREAPATANNGPGSGFSSPLSVRSPTILRNDLQQSP
jgi:hypothetical protein